MSQPATLAVSNVAGCGTEFLLNGVVLWIAMRFSSMILAPAKRRPYRPPEEGVLKATRCR